MLTKDFSFYLPPELIAQRPAEPRDSSKLMVVDRKTHNVQNKIFSDILEFLKPGDLVVWNNTKVFKARLKGVVLLDEASDGISKKVITTDKILNVPKVEVFLVRPMENKYVWKVLAKPGRRLRLGMKVVFAPDFMGEVMLKEKDGTILMQFQEDDLIVRAKANKYGEVPTPPYIKNPEVNTSLEERYQTVYSKIEGSVAAPTAGFHFTENLIEKMKEKGVEFSEVTLHVGLGTFLPVKTERVEDHKMHSEWVELSAKNADLINSAKKKNRRVIAIGTTSVRAIEGIAQRFDSDVKAYTGDINIFITPGYKFRVIDAMVTNFHLPESTLLMLICAFGGDKNFIIDCYKTAIENRYRFYSFGDAMFIY